MSKREKSLLKLLSGRADANFDIDDVVQILKQMDFVNSLLGVRGLTMNKYEVIIYWSDVDNVFIAEMPELKGCIAHGDTQDEALNDINLLTKEWLRIAKEKKWKIPEPKGRLIYA